MILPVIAKYEIDQLVEKQTDLFGWIEGGAFSIFLLIILFIFFLKACEKIFSSILSFIEYRYMSLFELDYERELFKKISQVPLGFFLSSRNKRIISQSMFGGQDLGNFLRGVIGPSVSSGIAIIGMLTVLSLAHIPLIGIIILSSIAIYAFEKYKEIYSLKNEIPQDYEYEHRLNRLKFELEENPHNITINGGNALLEEQFELVGKRQLELTQTLQKQHMILNLGEYFIQNIGNLVIKAVVGYLVLQNTQSVGFMTMTLLYLGQIENILQSFHHMSFQKNRFEDNLKKLDILLHITQVHIGNKSTQKADFTSIRLDNIEFSYPNISQLELKYFNILEERIKKYKSRTLSEYHKEELHMIQEAREDAKKENPIILNDLSLELKVGNVYGIIGKNGVGKTSLISLILGFFSSYQGDIYFGNNELRNISKENLYKNISVVNQIPYILTDFSVKENLLLGVKNSYSDEDIYRLLEKFGLTQKIKKLRLGLDSKIGYDSDFSGGEKQLLVLIRTILQDRKVLILDEGTNQLDAENELLVMQELLQNNRDKIIIFITHRMTTIRKADCIYCLEGGKITSSGTHTQLLGRKSLYKTFWEKQVEQ